MKFCVIKNSNNLFLGREYRQSYFYSTYTNESSSFDMVFRPLGEYLNDNPGYRLTIFESEDAARGEIRKNSGATDLSDCKFVHLSELEEL